jgi:hypothetical protein
MKKTSFQIWLEDNTEAANDMAKTLGFNKSQLTRWKKGQTRPRQEKMPDIVNFIKSRGFELEYSHFFIPKNR